MKEVHIIGGGLAGSEAAWQVAEAGHRAVLYEMRPIRQTQAHKTDRFAELVCSNSLKTETENSAPWLLKHELRRLGSLLLKAADKARVPGGQALTVDREVFATAVEDALEQHPRIELRREEVTALPDAAAVIIASGPLTSDAFTAEIGRITGSDRLYFYDAISPIVDAHSIDMSIAFRASRYGKSIDGSDDYINCPMNRDEYERFVDAVLTAESVPFHIAADAPCFLRSLPAGGGTGPSGSRYAALRADETDGPHRSAHGPAAVRGGPVAAGEPAGRQLQPGGVPEPHALPGTDARVPPDPRARRRRVPALRADPPQHLYQLAGAAHTIAAAAQRSARVLRRTDLGRRRLRGIDRHRPAGRAQCGRAVLRRRDENAAARDRARIPVPLHLGRRRPGLSTREHHF